MNPDLPKNSREELEAKVTALLLGELPKEEASALRLAIEKDEELARLYRRLKVTVDLVQEAAATQSSQSESRPAPLRLSAERREKLLQQLKTVTPREFAEPPRRETWWVVPVAIAAGLMLICGLTVLPALSKAKSKSMAYRGREELRFPLGGRHSQTATTHTFTESRRISKGEGAGVNRNLLEAFDSSAAAPATASAPEKVPSSTIVLPSDTAAKSASASTWGYYNADGTAQKPSEGPIALGGAPKQNEAPGAKYAPAETPAMETAVSEGIRLPTRTLRPESETAFARRYGLSRSESAGKSETRNGASDYYAMEPSTGLPKAQADAGAAAALAPPAAASAVPQGEVQSSSENQKKLSELSASAQNGRGKALAENSEAKSKAGTKELVPLELKLPAPAFKGTPKDIQLGQPHGEEQSSKELGVVAQSGTTPAVPSGGGGAGGLGGGAGLSANQKGVGLSSGATQQISGQKLRDQFRNSGDSSGVIADELFGALPATTAPTEVARGGRASKQEGVVEERLGEIDQLARGNKAAEITRAPVVGDTPTLGKAFKRKGDAVETEGRDSLKREVSADSTVVDTGGTARFYDHEFGVVSTNSLAYANKPASESSITLGVPLAQAEDSIRRGYGRGVSGPDHSEGKTSATTDQPAEAGRFSIVLPAQGQAGETAVNEGIYRQANRITLRQKLTDAQNAQERGGLANAAKLYDDAWELVQKVGAGADAEAQQAKTGLATVRVELARRAQNRGDLREAKTQAADALRVDPANPEALDFNRANEKLLSERRGKTSSEEIQNRVAGIAEEKVKTSTLVQDGKLLYEMGKLDQAEARLQKAVKEDPLNQGAYYYLNLIREARFHEALNKRDATSRMSLVEVENAWATPPKRELLPQPSQTAASNVVAQNQDRPAQRPVSPPPIPQPEIQTSENAFSTFSLNVSDVSFKLAGASLEKGMLPDAGTIRSEEFINAFDYRDPEAPPGVPVAFAWDRARYPFAQNRDLLRFSIKTAAQGRQAGRPLNIVLLLDNSGSMERADRVSIIREALHVLASQLTPQDKLSVATFARTARLWVDGVAGSQAAQVVEEISKLTPEGGTNLEEAMNLAYQTALRHYLGSGINRVVLLTDGAANLGNVEPDALKQKVESNRKQGVAFDCFGVGWEGYNDDLLEVLSRNGDGRYGFINTPEEASTEFAGKLAGALQVAASDVKVQVEFNPSRVSTYRQIGYAKHQLTKEQFRDNTVDAAEIAAAEAGNALYAVEVNPGGSGPLATVRVRYKVPGTNEYKEHEWAVPYNSNAASLDQASPAMRLAATASAFSEWLASSPYAAEVTPDRLLGYLTGVPEVYGADTRPKRLEWMIRQAKSLTGK